MIRLKLFVLLLLALTSKVQAQNSTDTLCRPVAVIKELLIRAKEGDAAKQQVLILEQRISEKQTIIAALQGKDSVTVATYNRELLLVLEELASVKSVLKKEKRRRFWTGVGGVMTTGIVTYLALKK